MSSELVTHISDAVFAEALNNSSTPVFVDFWAPWCGPCKALAPIIDEVAPEYEGRLMITKMNVDDNPETPAKFGIRGIPAMLIFKDGEVVGTKVGSVSASELRTFIDEHVKEAPIDEHVKEAPDEGYESE